MDSVSNKHIANNYISSSRGAQLTGYTQDYVGQLCRDARIDCKRLAGEWQVRFDTLVAYKARFNPDFGDAKHHTSTIGDHAIRDSHEEEIEEGGKKYISSAIATRLTGYTQDYIGQLARSGAVEGKKVGRKWFVDRQSLLQHKEHNDGLLAALQAQSVGVLPRKSERENASTEPQYPGSSEHSSATIHKIPIVRYHREDGSLIPSVEDRLEVPVREMASTTLQPEVHVPPLAPSQGGAPISIRRDVRDRSMRNTRYIPLNKPINEAIEPFEAVSAPLMSHTTPEHASDVTYSRPSLTSLLLSTMVILASSALIVIALLQPDVFGSYAVNALERTTIPVHDIKSGDTIFIKLLSWADGVTLYSKGE